MSQLPNPALSLKTTWFERIPKVELHLHLEGAIPHEALWQLVQKYGGDPLVPTLEAVQKKFEYRDFLHFVDAWLWKNQFIREYEDFSLIAKAVAQDLKQQNIRYVEAFYSPGDFARHGLKTQELTEAIRHGLSQVPYLEAHPIRRYFERGILVTVNTDDPKMFNNSLAQEYQLLEEKLGFSRSDIQTLILQGIESSWLSEDKKQQLITTFRNDAAWLEEAAQTA